MKSNVLIRAATIMTLAVTPAFAGSDAGAKELEALPDGYIAIDALPDSLGLIPPEPVYGSARQAFDNATVASAPDAALCAAEATALAVRP